MSFKRSHCLHMRNYHIGFMILEDEIESADQFAVFIKASVQVCQVGPYLLMSMGASQVTSPMKAQY